jgi:hypothetical protein
MDQQQQVNEAAEKFTDALRESYQAVADRTVSAQQINAELTQDFFNTVINNLRTQAESNRAAAQELAEQTQKGQEAGQLLAQESVGAYMDFMNSMFSFYQEGAETAGSSAQAAAESSAQAAESGAQAAESGAQAAAEDEAESDDTGEAKPRRRRKSTAAEE